MLIKKLKFLGRFQAYYKPTNIIYYNISHEYLRISSLITVIPPKITIISEAILKLSCVYQSVTWMLVKNTDSAGLGKDREICILKNTP